MATRASHGRDANPIAGRSSDSFNAHRGGEPAWSHRRASSRPPRLWSHGSSSVSGHSAPPRALPRPTARSVALSCATRVAPIGCESGVESFRHAGTAPADRRARRSRSRFGPYGAGDARPMIDASVLVVGGGAIGGITAAKLAGEVRRVVVLDTNEEHVARLREPGLTYEEEAPSTPSRSRRPAPPTSSTASSTSRWSPSSRRSTRPPWSRSPRRGRWRRSSRSATG